MEIRYGQNVRDKLPKIECINTRRFWEHWLTKAIGHQQPAAKATDEILQLISIILSTKPLHCFAA